MAKQKSKLDVPSDSKFFKSSLSNGGGGRGGHCVSVAFSEESVFVRNSNDAGKKTISFTIEEWKAFVGGVKNGEFDTPQ